MHKLQIKKGYRFKIEGEPAKNLTVLDEPDEIGVLPAKIPFIKPKLQITEGDSVRIGSLLFVDKRCPDFKFLSPASGKIKQIRFGPRRAIEAIVIASDKQDQASAFDKISPDKLASTSRQQVVAHILNGGLWALLRALPFRDLPDPAEIPPLILVGLGSKDPFQPLPEVYLQDRLELFAYGLAVLRKLSNDNIMVFADARNTALPDFCGRHITHSVSGRYPSDDAGTVLYHTKTSSQENKAWFIDGQDVLLLAELLQHGRYPTQRIVAVGGSAARQKGHVRTRLGAPLAHLAGRQEQDADTRYVVGGLMRGYASDQNGFMGLRETSLTVLPEGSEAEFLALFKPGLKKPSYSKAFLSKLNPANLTYNCNLNGGRRACIGCMHCADVCPVDILPQMTYKAILAEEVEEYLAHGLLDCVECGLCAYVCPSKIELTRSLVDAKAAYAKELVRFTPSSPEDEI